MKNFSSIAAQIAQEALLKFTCTFETFPHSKYNIRFRIDRFILYYYNKEKIKLQRKRRIIIKTNLKTIRKTLKKETNSN